MTQTIKQSDNFKIHLYIHIQFNKILTDFKALKHYYRRHQTALHDKIIRDR